MKSIIISLTALVLATTVNAQQSPQTKSSNPQNSLVFKCQKQKTCRFHIVGALTPAPIGVFSVTPEVWRKFSESDREVYRALAKLWLSHVATNPLEALTDKQNGGKFNLGAPILPRAAANVQKNLSRVEFLVATSKMADGSPGWSECRTVPELEVLR